MRHAYMSSHSSLSPFQIVQNPKYHGAELKAIMNGRNKNLTSCLREGRTCHPECDDSGCWGPGEEQVYSRSIQIRNFHASRSRESGLTFSRSIDLSPITTRNVSLVFKSLSCRHFKLGFFIHSFIHSFNHLPPNA